MNDSVHVRPARSGDICVLIEPSDQDEIRALAERIADLQSRLGGSPIEQVHLTCQRFACEDEHLIRRLSQNLESALIGAAPFPLTAHALTTLSVPVRQFNTLKWKCSMTDAMAHFAQIVVQNLIHLGIEPLYQPGFISSWVTALRDVPADITVPSPTDDEFPYHLFTTDKVVLSRIADRDEFEILATIQLKREEP